MTRTNVKYAFAHLIGWWVRMPYHPVWSRWLWWTTGHRQSFPHQEICRRAPTSTGCVSVPHFPSTCQRSNKQSTLILQCLLRPGGAQTQFWRLLQSSAQTSIKYTWTSAGHRLSRTNFGHPWLRQELHLLKCRVKFISSMHFVLQTWMIPCTKVFVLLFLRIQDMSKKT